MGQVQQLIVVQAKFFSAWMLEAKMIVDEEGFVDYDAALLESFDDIRKDRAI